MIIFHELMHRVEFAREILGPNKTDLAKALGYSLEGYRAIADGRTDDPRNKQKLIEVLKVDPSWLFLKNGGVVAYTEDGDAVLLPVNHVPLFTIDQVSPNMNVTFILADTFKDFLDKNFSFKKSITEEMKSPRIKTKKSIVPVSRECSLKSYAITVKGDSMMSSFAGKLSFLEGDIIIIDPEREPKNGDFVIVQQKDQEAIFKKYVNEGNNSYFTSLNPHYKDIPNTKNIKILGVVVERKNYF